jgi:uncharacterized repeat protein (TIGR01451 family)
MIGPRGWLVTSILAFHSFLPARAQSYSISTYAGGLAPPTTSAAIDYAIGAVGFVTADNFGNIYFSSTSQCIFKLDPRGMLTRMAGTCEVGFSGDGGPAVNAQLNAPFGLAVDSHGNLYFADCFNHRVRMVSSTGIITTVAGNGSIGYSGNGGPATKAQLNYPNSVAVDSSGNLYITDAGNNVVREVSGGTITTIAGTGSAGFSGDNGPSINAQFHYPTSMALDAAGNIFVTDSQNQRVRRIGAGAASTVTTVAGTGIAGYSGDSGPANAAQLNSPAGLALDASGSLYIADTSNFAIRKIAAAGIITTAAGGKFGSGGDRGPVSGVELAYPEAVAVDPAGNLFIADSSNLRIRRVNPKGGVSTVAGNGQALPSTGDGGPAALATLAGNHGISIDGAGNLYVGETGSHRIRKITPAGTITTLGATGAGDYNLSVAADFSGNVYFTTQARVSRMAPDGTITAIAGIGIGGYSGDGGPAISAQLSANIAGIAVDANGNVYFSDANNYRVRKVTRAGVISTVAGTGVSGASGEGVSGVAAQLSSPQSLAVDDSGNLYIADSPGVRKLAVNGIISTVARPNTPITSLALDSNGNLFIGTPLCTVLQVSPAGVVSTIAGSGVPGYSGDGGPATAARMFYPYGLAVDASGRVYISDTNQNAVRVAAPATQALVAVSSTHSGNFTAGQIGVYAINVTAVGTVTGALSVTDFIPAGLALVSLAGSGWVCSSNTCTSNGSVPSGGSYPPITAIVFADSAAPPQVTNEVMASLAGTPAAGGQDATFIVSPIPVLEISVARMSDFVQGQSNALYSVWVGNRLDSTPISGAVTVTESLPQGLSLVNMSGSGWVCSVPSATCTRNGALGGGSSYPPITVTVSVSQSAAAMVVNYVSVSGTVSQPGVASVITPVAPVCDGVIGALGDMSVVDFRRERMVVRGSGCPY